MALTISENKIKTNKYFKELFFSKFWFIYAGSSLLITQTISSSYKKINLQTLNPSHFVIHKNITF